jgi:hypothetical protein
MEDRCLKTILLKGEVGWVRRESKWDLAAAVRARYFRVGKGRILDEFCAATGYHRVYARRLLGRGLPAPRSDASRRYARDAPRLAVAGRLASPGWRRGVVRRPALPTAIVSWVG